jgi:hypothetical protein
MLHFADVRYSLAGGFYQGWDLHGAQLVSRYAAVASFYLEGIDTAGARPQGISEQGGDGDARWRRARRTGDRAGTARFFSPCHSCRRDHGV